jgi:pimeloyl-ACP methyl ester carboxylesterase
VRHQVDAHAKRPQRGRRVDHGHAASSAIPASVTADIGPRPAPAIETIAYFCAAELIANATKHSYADQIKIKIYTERTGLLRLEVSDDGVGGADAGRGSGLAGLEKHVASTRVPKISYGAFLTNRRYRRGGLRLIATALTGRIGAWTSYLNVAFPGPKPADYAEAIAALRANLREPGRMAVAQQMGKAQPTDAEAKLASIRCPALVIMGTLDSDWVNPRAEADAIVAAMPAGLGRAVMIDGAGHYPHTQFPDQVAAALLPFLKEHAGA